MALTALARIEEEDAYANLVLPPLLGRSKLDRRDRALVTELVYGTTRMRRACDWLVDRFVLRDLDPEVRRVLRLGAYQLHHMGVPPHAAVSATVGLVDGRARGLVNAVLRRVADDEARRRATDPPAALPWPDDATRLSYPDHVVERLRADLGDADALAALAQMNEAPEVTTRADGYVQDLASQWVVDLIDAGPGDRVVDVCAAPGGKATGLTAGGAWVAATDRTASRARLVAANATRLDLAGKVGVATADALHPPFPPATFDRVLLDAPCAGLGVLRRRPDARWRVDPEAVDRLAALQRRLLAAAAPLVRPGGVLVYSVCTLSAAETTGIDEFAAEQLDGFVSLDPPAAPWRPHGRGALLLPQAVGTDGMFILRLRRGQ